MFKAMRSNIKIEIIPPRIVRFRSYLVQFDKVTCDTVQISKVNGSHDKVTGSKVSSQGNVTYQ